MSALVVLMLFTLVSSDEAGDIKGSNGQTGSDNGEYEGILSSQSFLSFRFDRDAIMKSCFDS